MNISLKRLSLHSDISRTSGSGVWRKDLSLDQGSFVLVSAPSGNGKTTLLSILYGLRQDYHGEAFLGGKNLRLMRLNDWSSLRRKTMSIVFQNLKLFPDLSGMENILIKADLAGCADRDHIVTMARRLGIYDLLNNKCRYLSMGEKQRIAVIRALVQPFNWLLLDEPFSHLDERTLIAVRDLLLEECKKRKAGLIITSLSLDDYFPYSTRILM